MTFYFFTFLKLLPIHYHSWTNLSIPQSNGWSFILTISIDRHFNFRYLLFRLKYAHTSWSICLEKKIFVLGLHFSKKNYCSISYTTVKKYDFIQSFLHHFCGCLGKSGMKWFLSCLLESSLLKLYFLGNSTSLNIWK